MPVKTSFVTKEFIKGIELPTHGNSYTIIPHAHAIDETYKAILQEGFTLKNETYKCTLDGQVAQGIYYLDYRNDPDMGLMFAWSNSYNKTMKFKCAVGSYVFICMNGVVSGDMGSFVRKHTGSALTEATFKINEQLSKAKNYYNTLVEDKQILKNVLLTPKEKGTVLGRLFAEQEILTLTQVGIVKREMDNPSHNYNCNPDSAWAMYNHVTFALKESHPRTYLDDHEVLHNFFITEYSVRNTTPLKVESIKIDYQEEEVLEEPSEFNNGVVFL